jgi:prolyl oligopeptidase
VVRIPWYSLSRAKFTGVAWTHDDKGFFYNRYPEPSTQVQDAGTETDSNTNAYLCYHKIGTKQSDDVVCFKDPDHPSRMFSAVISDDGLYAILTVSESCDPKNLLYIAKLNQDKSIGDSPCWKGVVTQVLMSMMADM